MAGAPAPAAAALDDPRLARAHIRMFREFTPSWFTACMGTGACALSVANFPWPFAGQWEIALAIWALNVAVFCLFSVQFIGRLVAFPKTIGPLMDHRSEPLFLGAIPMAFAVIANGFAVLIAPRMPLGPALRVACGLWFANLPMTLATSLIFPFFIISRHHNTQESMTAVWLLPIVPSNVAAGSAGILATAYAAALDDVHQETREIVAAVVFIGVILFSYGLLLTLSICTIYYHRLMVHRQPPAAQLISSFLPVGATAMLAFSAANLGSADLLHALPGADPELLRLAEGLRSASLALSVVMWSYALWWLVVAAASVIDNLRVLHFNLGWWGSVFPVGTLSVVTARLGTIFKIDALKGIAAVLVITTVVLWLIVASTTAIRGYKGHLFYAPCLHTYQAAVAAAGGATAAGAGRVRSQHLCTDPGLSLLGDEEAAAEAAAEAAEAKAAAAEAKAAAAAWPAGAALPAACEMNGSGAGGAGGSTV